MDQNKKELHIIDGIKSGNESAYRMLFERYYPKLVVFAKKYLEDLEDARDLVQEFLMHLYESRESVSIQTSLKAYLYGSVRNRCLNRLKHGKVMEKHRNFIKQEGTGPEQDPELEENMDATELQERIFKVISGLPEQCRRIYLMSRVDGKRNREISEELGLSVRTVETQISRALKVLRNNLLR